MIIQHFNEVFTAYDSEHLHYKNSMLNLGLEIKIDMSFQNIFLEYLKKM